MNDLFNNLTPFHFALIGVGVFVMATMLMRTLSTGTFSRAAVLVQVRRAYEAELRSIDAAAEAIGRAAAREPLALNSDGSVAEPIIAAVERPRIS